MQDGPLRETVVAPGPTEKTENVSPSPSSVPSPLSASASPREKLLAFLRGKRTYLLVAAGLLYIAGAEFDLWAFDETVLNGIGLGALVTIRAAIKNNL